MVQDGTKAKTIVILETPNYYPKHLFSDTVIIHYKYGKE